MKQYFSVVGLIHELTAIACVTEKRAAPPSTVADSTETAESALSRNRGVDERTGGGPQHQNDVCRQHNIKL